MKLAISNAKIVRVTCFGVVINVFLSIVKITIGSFSGSMALVADGIHSLSDMVTDVVVLLGTHLGSKKPDSRHPYGHGRIETFSALAVAIILAVVGSFMIFKAAKCMYRLSLGLEDVNPIGISVLYAALLSVVLKEMLY